MSEVQISKLQDHMVFYISIIFSFSIAYIIVYLLYFLVPQLFPGTNGILLIAFPIYIWILMLIIVKLAINFDPAISLQSYPTILNQIVAVVILSTQYTLFFSNSKFVYNLEFAVFFDTGLGYLVILNFVLGFLTIVMISKFLFTKQSPKTTFQRIKEKLLNETAFLISSLSIFILLTASSRLQGLDSLDFTGASKIAGLMLIMFITQPQINK